MARAARDFRFDVCSRCDQFSHGPPSVCRKLSGSLIDALAAAAGPICPIGKHDKLPQAAVSAPVRRCRVKAWISGAAKLLVATLRLCRASREARALRRAACRGCVHRRRHWRLVDVCTKCGCLVRPKTALATEGCPIGAWKAEAGGCVVMEELECLGIVAPCRTGGCGK